MTPSKSDDNSVLLVHAYLDGELDPVNALGIAQRLSTDPALAAEGERVKALQQLIRERFPREGVPPGLRARIEASVGGIRTCSRTTVVAGACRISRTYCLGRKQLHLVRRRFPTRKYAT